MLRSPKEMDKKLRDALQILIVKDDEGRIFDCEADEGGYRSEELERALDTIRAFLEAE